MVHTEHRQGNRVALLNERFQEATRLVTEAGGGT
jgi:hypothetical protein